MCSMFVCVFCLCLCMDWFCRLDSRKGLHMDSFQMCVCECDHPGVTGRCNPITNYTLAGKYFCNKLALFCVHETIF